MVIDGVLVTFGVAPKVIVIIKNEDRFVGPELLAIKKCSCKAAQTRAYHHKIIRFLRINNLIEVEVGVPCAGMSHCVRSGVVAAQTC